MKWMKLLFTLLVAAAIPLGSGLALAGGSENTTTHQQVWAPLVAVQSSSSLKRIQFATGATSAVVSGKLSAHQTARYVLRAMASQLMDVDLSAPDGFRLSVTTSSGRSLSAVTGGSTAFRGYLPRNGDYILTVDSRSKRGSYSLSVSIPERIAFARGATSASIDGQVETGQGHDYILRAAAGQLMQIDVTPDEADTNLQLIIFGADGSVLRSGMSEGSSFSGVLPVSEDYLVSVRAVDQDVSFTMNVIIPQRIRFQAGAFSGSVKDTLRPNHSQYYVLRALKGQTMQVQLTSEENLRLAVSGADGTVLSGRSSEGTGFRARLPKTQDYVVEVKAGADRASYTLRVTIR